MEVYYKRSICLYPRWICSVCKAVHGPRYATIGSVCVDIGPNIVLYKSEPFENIYWASDRNDIQKRASIMSNCGINTPFRS